jgi:lathosterol oxidase
MMDFLQRLAIGGGMHFFRYFFFAGLAYLIFYVIFRSKWSRKKIQTAFPKGKQIQREITYSVLSIGIFITFFGISVWMTSAGLTKIYMNFSAHSVYYFLFSVILLIFWHDTYFYWTHRLLHMKRFARFHRLHHQSHNTTPWTSFAFHPVEACVQAAFIPLILPFVPFHPIAIGIVITWQMAFNVMGHLGYEIFPVWFHKSVVGRLFNTSTHHNMHHQYAGANYGLYFNVWDRVMRTNHARYEQTFMESSEKMYGGGVSAPLDLTDGDESASLA